MFIFPQVNSTCYDVSNYEIPIDVSKKRIKGPNNETNLNISTITHEYYAAEPEYKVLEPEYQVLDQNSLTNSTVNSIEFNLYNYAYDAFSGIPGHLNWLSTDRVSNEFTDSNYYSTVASPMPNQKILNYAQVYQRK